MKTHRNLKVRVILCVHLERNLLRLLYVRFLTKLAANPVYSQLSVSDIVVLERNAATLTAAVFCEALEHTKGLTSCDVFVPVLGKGIDMSTRNATATDMFTRSKRLALV